MQGHKLAFIIRRMDEGMKMNYSLLVLDEEMCFKLCVNTSAAHWQSF